MTRHHDRSAFDWGVAALNEYLQRYARPNHEGGGAKTFVAVPMKAPAPVLGYYTFGALRLLDDPLKLVLPLDTIAAALKLNRGPKPRGGR